MKAAEVRTESVADRPRPSAVCAGLAPRPYGLAFADARPGLTIGHADDPAEREADRMAERALRGDSPVRAGRAAPALRRACADCEEEDMRIRRDPASGSDRHGGAAAPPAVSTLLAQPGRALDPAARQFFETRFGRDFGDVAVHDGPAADSAARAIGARAFTAGSHVAFARGEYAPQTTAGRHLLGHELAHVAQQGGGGPAHPVQRAGIGARADNRFELEANRTADLVMGPAATGAPAIHAVAPAAIAPQRSVDPEEPEDEDAAGDAIDREYGLQAKADSVGVRVGRAAGLPIDQGGVPLPPQQRAFLEQRFSRDLGAVRIHTGSEADRSARSLAALAYTAGPNIVFRSGQYSPTSDKGCWLLAHELTHVAQQGHAPPLDAAAMPVSAMTRSAPQLFTDSALPTRQAIDTEYAKTLNDSELDDAIRTVEQATEAEKESSAYTDRLFANLAVLKDERFARDNRSEAPKATPPTAPDEDEMADFDEAEFDVEDENWKPDEPKPGLVRADPANFWASSTTKDNPASLPMNTKLIAYFTENDRTRVALEDGRTGWIAAKFVETKLPDPDSVLHLVKTRDTAQTIARKYYSAHAKEWGQDERYFVNVIYYTNQLFRAKGDASGITRPKDRQDEWRATTVISGSRIWIPGIDYALGLKGAVSSGSISYEVDKALKEFFIGGAGLISGILVGALESIVDIFVGLWDLVKMAWKVIKSLITGNIVSDAKKLWEDLSKLTFSDIVDAGWEWLKAKWTSDGKSTWSTWYDRGWLIGYIAAEIALLIFSGGAATAVKWAGKSAKFVKLLEKLPTLARFVKRVEEAGVLKAGADVALDGLRLGAKALTKAHQWAQTVLRIPLEILKDTAEAAVQRLQKLSGWAKEKFRHLSPAAMKTVLGCASPCKIDIHDIEEYFRTLAPKAGKAAAKLGSNVDKILAALPSGLNKTLIAEKLKTRPALKMLIEAAELTADDFAKMADFAITAGDKANAAMSYRTFVRYLTAVVPAKAGGDIKKFNKIAEAIMKTGGTTSDRVKRAIIRQGSALKGSMFEGFARLNFPELGGKEFVRITFEKSSVLKLEKARRTADSFVAATGELWEIKHITGKVPADQIRDYAKILGSKGKVKSVNYVFPNKAAADVNKAALQQANFIVRYVDDAGKLVILP